MLFVIFGIFSMYYYFSKKNSLNIDAEIISKVEIITQGEYHLVTEEKKEINNIIKKINKIKFYTTNDLPGERSPYAQIILYDRNSEEKTVYFYGGMAGYNNELYTTGFLTSWQLQQIYNKAK